MTFIYLLFLVIRFIYLLCQRHLTTSSTPPTTTQLFLYATVEEAIAEAERICAQDPSSPECRVAWDVVEELEAADSHRSLHTEGGGYSTSDVMQDPADTMDYAAMKGSFDILMQKIDGKMDQLMATTNKLAELGAVDDSILELGARAEDMKLALQRADAYLNPGLYKYVSYYKKAGVCLSFCLSVTEKFVDLSPSAETGLRRA